MIRQRYRPSLRCVSPPSLRIRRSASTPAALLSARSIILVNHSWSSIRQMQEQNDQYMQTRRFDHCHPAQLAVGLSLLGSANYCFSGSLDSSQCYSLWTVSHLVVVITSVCRGAGPLSSVASIHLPLDSTDTLAEKNLEADSVRDSGYNTVAETGRARP